VTAVGILTVKRRYWQCRCGQAGGYAADAVLGRGARYSQVVQKPCCRLAADASFAQASEHLREMLGVHLAPETVRTLVEAHGQAMASFQPRDEATGRAFAAAPGAVEFAVDAGKVHTREEGWKDLKIAVVSKRPLGAPATPAQGCAPERLPRATARVAFAMIAPAQVFRRAWIAPLRRLGVTSLASVHALGDGAAWIWKSVNRVLRGSLQTLDLYHASARLNQCAEALFGVGSAAARTAWERGRELVLSDGWSGVWAWVEELLAVPEGPEWQRRRAATDGLLRYFAPHKHRLNYRECLASGRTIGSGVVEGAAKTLGLRLKRRGARWRYSQVRPMASLVCVRNSSQWEAYWSSRARPAA
jgi:hypothetical protein